MKPEELTNLPPEELLKIGTNDLLTRLGNLQRLFERGGGDLGMPNIVGQTKVIEIILKKYRDITERRILMALNPDEYENVLPLEPTPKK